MNIQAFASATAPLRQQAPRFERLEVVESDIGGVIAPWWANIIVERVATADGRPMPTAFVEQYVKLFKSLADLQEHGNVEAGAILLANELLLKSMFNGAVVPSLSWHGGDAVVFIWAAGKSTQYFTITADAFSCLKECDGEITERIDDLPPSAWDLLFPVPNGVH